MPVFSNISVKNLVLVRYTSGAQNKQNKKCRNFDEIYSDMIIIIITYKISAN